MGQKELLDKIVDTLYSYYEITLHDRSLARNLEVKDSEDLEITRALITPFRNELNQLLDEPELTEILKNMPEALTENKLETQKDSIKPLLLTLDSLLKDSLLKEHFNTQLKDIYAGKHTGEGKIYSIGTEAGNRPDTLAKILFGLAKQTNACQTLQDLLTQFIKDRSEKMNRSGFLQPTDLPDQASKLQKRSRAVRKT